MACFLSLINEYTVTWKDDLGNTLRTDTLEYGDVPMYGVAPTKAADAQYTYTFKNWSPAITPVEGDQTYTAVFDQTVNKYTITFKNWDGTILHTHVMEYGQMPGYSVIPTRPKTPQYTYTFTDWSPVVTSVVGDQEYIAQYSETLNTYTVTWKNWDNTTLETERIYI